MRTLLISTLFAILIGCCPMPPQARSKACTSEGCFHRTAAGSPIEIKPVSFKSSSVTTKVKATTAAETSRPSAAEQGKEVFSATASTPEVPASVQPSETADAVLKNAKTTIAAKMENPASVEFREMKRAERKNAVGKSIDSICGYVRGKTASGEETGDKPFLYLVQEDEAYIGGYSIATSPHHNICD